MIRRPALRYFGGKWRLAPWIISHFPEHVVYVEPFMGGASVFFRKEPSPIEVINDLDSELVNFFRVLREQPDELIRQIEATPYSREEFLNCYGDPPANPVERARQMYICAWQSHGGARRHHVTGWRTGSRGQNGRAPVTEDWNATERLQAIAGRLKHAFIEHKPALEIIAKYDRPDALFYIDPPYPHSTRSKRWGTNAYAKEMTDDEHAELAQVLHSVRGMTIISSVPSDLYANLYSDWVRADKKHYTAGIGPGGQRKYTEIIYLSPNIDNRQKAFL